jgi:hypothetical protein
MNNIDYQHSISQSFQSKLIQVAIGLFGMKHKTEIKMITNGFAKKPSKIPYSLLKRFNIQEAEKYSRKIWTVSPADSKSDLIILYFHGGAYMSNLLNEKMPEQVNKKSYLKIHYHENQICKYIPSPTDWDMCLCSGL